MVSILIFFLIAWLISIGRVIPMETVRLSRIVMKLTPELFPFLKRSELDSEIVLVHGIEALAEADAMEIIQFSISEHQKDAHLH
jgi:hypothetical protein